MTLPDLYKKDKNSLLTDLQSAVSPQAAIGVIYAYVSKITEP